MTKTLPEISRLQELLDDLSAEPSIANQPALNVVVSKYVKIVGEISSEDAFYLLLHSVNELPDLIEQQFSEGGRLKAGLNVASRLKSIFSPRLLAQPYEAFLSRSSVDRAVAASAMALLEDITFDGDAILSKSIEVVDEISKVREKIMSAESLSYSSRVFLSAQFELIERSVLRFETSGVGPFRDAIFTSIGKVFVELKGQTSEAKVLSRELIDDLLRIYGLLQVGGDLAKLTAPIVLKALSAPASV